jgi:2-methylcitrate dehydratase PrpD
MTITERLANAILGVRFDHLPSAAIDMAKAVALDGVAVTLAGATEPLGLGRIVTVYVRQLGGTPEATVLAGGFQTAMPNAAFANGTMAHVLDFNKMTGTRHFGLPDNVVALTSTETASRRTPRVEGAGDRLEQVGAD